MAKELQDRWISLIELFARAERRGLCETSLAEALLHDLQSDRIHLRSLKREFDWVNPSKVEIEAQWEAREKCNDLIDRLDKSPPLSEQVRSSIEAKLRALKPRLTPFQGWCERLSRDTNPRVISQGIWLEFGHVGPDGTSTWPIIDKDEEPELEGGYIDWVSGTLIVQQYLSDWKLLKVEYPSLEIESKSAVKALQKLTERSIDETDLGHVLAARKRKPRIDDAVLQAWWNALPDDVRRKNRERVIWPLCQKDNPDFSVPRRVVMALEPRNPSGRPLQKNAPWD